MLKIAKWVLSSVLQFWVLNADILKSFKDAKIGIFLSNDVWLCWITQDYWIIKDLIFVECVNGAFILMKWVWDVDSFGWRMNFYMNGMSSCPFWSIKMMIEVRINYRVTYICFIIVAGIVTDLCIANRQRI